MLTGGLPQCIFLNDRWLGHLSFASKFERQILDFADDDEDDDESDDDDDDDDDYLERFFDDILGGKHFYCSSRFTFRYFSIWD